ncbi:MAG TPA: type II toxin-antitoxin system HicA family toxin [Chloroflexota bacterium]
MTRALERDGWAQDVTRGAVRVYRHSDGERVTIHYHPGKTYGRKLLEGLLEDIGWSEADLRRLRLINDARNLTAYCLVVGWLG